MTDLNSTEVQSRTITAFFDTRGAADTAVSDLVAAGLPREHITVAGSGEPTASGATDPDDRGFWENLKDLFLPDEDRHTYAEGMRRGGFLVSVRTEEANYNRVLTLLDRDGAVDIDERAATWRNEGWTGQAEDRAFAGVGSGAGFASTTTASPAPALSTAVFADTASSSTAFSDTASSSTALSETAMSSAAVIPPATRAPQPAATSAMATTGREEVIPVYEEKLNVGKRDVNNGLVRVRSYVVETPVNEQVSLRNESVQIERRPVDRPVSAADALFQERTIEAEEHSEEAVIAKETRVKEEITLRKTAEEQTRSISDTVRHTEVEVEDQRGHATGGVAAFATADATRIAEHMDVIASDGAKIGTVDHLDGPDRIKLAKNTSPDGQHHLIPLTWVDHVDTHVHLRVTGAEAKAGW